MRKLEPFILGMISTAGGGAGPFAPTPHELNGAHHTGTLTTTQYPDALLRDGSRSLTGNLSVGTGITIDGVDISAHVVDANAHHAQQHALIGADHTATGLTAGYVVRASGATTFAFAQLQHSDLGGVSADQHHDHVTLDVNADTLLSLSTQQIGLDTQAANRVLAGPASGGAAVPTFRALVAADIPALGATPALTFTTANAAGSAATYVRTDASLAIFDATNPTTIQPGDSAAAGSVAFAARRDHRHAIATAAPGANSVNLSTSTDGTATSFSRSSHTHQLDVGIAPTWTALHTFNSGIDITGTIEFQGAGTITTTTGTDVTLSPTGNVVVNPAGNYMLPGVNYDINLGMLSKKYLTLHAAELWVETLVAQGTVATIGGRILVGPTTTLTSDLAAAETTIYVKHNQMATGDRVYMEANGSVEFMTITAGPSGTGPYTYTVVRNIDGTGANDWYAGDAIFNTGAPGDGFIDIYSVRSVKSATQYGPTIVGNVRNSATYNDWSECWAVGNLNGVYGYGTNTYGVGLGKYSAADYITIDPTNGIRFLDASNVVQAQLSASVWTMGRVAASYSNIQISAGVLSLRNNTTERIGLTAAGVLTVKNSVGNAVFTFNASSGAEFTLPLTLAATGGIYQGTGTFASPTTGLKVWNDGGIGRIAGYNSSTIQWYANTTGQMLAGSGNVILDADGITIISLVATGDSNAYKFSDGTYKFGGLYTYCSPPPAASPFYTIEIRNDGTIPGQPNGDRYITMDARGNTGYSGNISLTAFSSTSNVVLSLGANYGSQAFALVDDRLLVASSASGYTGAENFTVDGTAAFSEYIYHYGDSNTYQRYRDDQWTLVCGGVTMLDAVEAATDYIQIGAYVGIGAAPTSEMLYVLPSDSVSVSGIIIKQGLTSGASSWQNLLQILNKSDAEQLVFKARGSDGATALYLSSLGTVSTRDANGFGFLTSANAAQVIQAKAVLLGTSYSSDISAIAANTIASVAGTSIYLNPSGGTVGIGTTSIGGVCTIDQPSTTAAIPVLELDQADLSEEFINFISTIGAGYAIDTAAVGTYYGKVRVAVNGTFKYVALYNS